MSRKAKEQPIDDPHAYLISQLSKAGIKSYQEAFLAEELEYTTVKAYIPTGIVPVDAILGGGFPVGRFSEIYGPEAVWKSGLGQMALECAMGMGGIGLLFDNEETFDETRSVLHKNPSFIYEISTSLEAFFARVKTQLKIIAEVPDALSLVLWDSMPATLPTLILESDEGERTLGEAARIMAIEIPRCKHLIRESLCAFIAINQVRANMQRVTRFEPAWQTPGGWAPKFFATVRVLLQSRGKFQWFADSIENHGTYIEVLVEKNKNFRPFQRAKFPIVWQDNRGGDPAMSYWDWATGLEEITPGGGPGKWNFGPVIADLKVHKIDFHHAYREHLDKWLDYFESKTGFRYADLARTGVKALTERIYAKTTEIVREPKRPRPKSVHI